jgi:hypothetical protein
MANGASDPAGSLNETNKAALDLKKSLEQILDTQGDYNNLIKSAIKNLKQTETSYEKIEARLASLNKGSINVRQVNQDLFRLKQKEYIEQKRLLELQHEYGDTAKNTLKTVKERVEADINGYKELNKYVAENQRINVDEIDIHKEILYYLEREGNLQAIKLYSQEKQIGFQKERTEQAKNQLAIEQQASKQMGLSGNLVSSLSKKLGLGEVIYEKMVARAKDLVQENGKATSGLNVAKTGIKAIVEELKNSYKSASFGTKVMSVFSGAIIVIRGALKLASIAGNALGSAMTKVGSTIKGLSPVSSDFMSNLVGPINGMIEKIPVVGGLLSGLIGFWASILDLVIGVEDYIVKSGRQIGLNASQAIKFNDQLAEAGKNSGKIYANSKALFDSQLELTKATELNNIASQKNLETNIELAKFAGLELETRSKIYEASVITGTSMESIAKSIVGQVANLRRTTGIAFNYQSILKEAASQSGRLGLMFAKYPSQLAKSLISVKALGLEMKQLESIGDSMLDFESSISKEFEAQLLLGRDINLNKAREAFLNNDLVTAAAEITKYTGDANGFLKLNRIQQQSLADLMGMTVDGMSDFLKKQEMYIKTGATNQQQLIKQVELSRANTAEKEKMIKLLGEENYQSLVNLSVQEKLMSAFDKIKQSLVDFLTKSNILEKIQYYADWLTKPENIESAVNTVKGVLAKIFDFVSGLSSVILDLIAEVGTWVIIGDDKKEKAFVDRVQALNRGQQDINQKIQDNFAASMIMKSESKKSLSEDKEEDGSPAFRKAMSSPNTKSVKDAVIFPNSNTVINKDPLDYTIFTKNPSNLSAPQINQEAIEKIVKAISNRPVIVNTNTNLNLDGQVAAKSNYTNMKNNPLLGFDRTFGQMSLNT